MHFKTILALFALASVAAAHPAEDPEKRAQCDHTACCTKVSGNVGQGCQLTDKPCGTGHRPPVPLCCSTTPAPVGGSDNFKCPT